MKKLISQSGKRTIYFLGKKYFLNFPEIVFIKNDTDNYVYFKINEIFYYTILPNVYKKWVCIDECKNVFELRENFWNSEFNNEELYNMISFYERKESKHCDCYYKDAAHQVLTEWQSNDNYISENLNKLEISPKQDL